MAARERVSLFRLADVRDYVAGSLANASPPDDAYVHAGPVDGLSPPALMLQWGDPWLTAGGGVAGARPVVGGPCIFTARLEVICVGSRIEALSGFQTCEALAAYVIDTLHADPYTWPLATVTSPRGWRIMDVPYIAASVVYAVPVAL